MYPQPLNIKKIRKQAISERKRILDRNTCGNNICRNLMDEFDEVQYTSHNNRLAIRHGIEHMLLSSENTQIP